MGLQSLGEKAEVLSNVNRGKLLKTTGQANVNLKSLAYTVLCYKTALSTRTGLKGLPPESVPLRQFCAFNK
jgi:hypothetical protein